MNGHKLTLVHHGREDVICFLGCVCDEAFRSGNAVLVHNFHTDVFYSIFTTLSINVPNRAHSETKDPNNNDNSPWTFKFRTAPIAGAATRDALTVAPARRRKVAADEIMVVVVVVLLMAL